MAVGSKIRFCLVCTTMGKMMEETQDCNYACTHEILIKQWFHGGLRENWKEEVLKQETISDSHWIIFSGELLESARLRSKAKSNELWSCKKGEKGSTSLSCYFEFPNVTGIVGSSKKYGTGPAQKTLHAWETAMKIIFQCWFIMQGGSCSPQKEIQCHTFLQMLPFPAPNFLYGTKSHILNHSHVLLPICC